MDVLFCVLFVGKLGTNILDDDFVAADGFLILDVVLEEHAES